MAAGEPSFRRKPNVEGPIQPETARDIPVGLIVYNIVVLLLAIFGILSIGLWSLILDHPEASIGRLIHAIVQHMF